MSSRFKHSTEFATPKARMRLAPRKKPYSFSLSPGIQLLYRRNKGAGAWAVKQGWVKGFGIADDFEAANGSTVFDYQQAVEKARTLARAGEGNTTDKPITLDEAIADYKIDLKARGANLTNATTLLLNLKGSPMLSKSVALLTEKELRTWRNGMVAGGLAPASADRIGRSMKATLNLAARNDKRITNAGEWRAALSRLKGSNRTRDNIILTDDQVKELVREVHATHFLRGLWCDVLAETGARESQCRKLTVADLQDSGTYAKTPRLMMPSSMKGKNREQDIKPVPISVRLARLLRQGSAGRKAHEPLLTAVAQLAIKIRPEVKRLGHGPEIVPYSFRHSSIVRMLLKGVNIRIVASHHDTSVGEIERVYSKHITDFTDQMLRDTLIDFDAAPVENNIVKLSR
jgi:integrase